MGKAVNTVRMAISAAAMAVVLGPVAASAQVQGVNLNGRYQCLALCFGPPGGVAVVTRYGWQLNVVNEAGVPSRGWVDYPGRIWLEQYGLGALYTPDGLRIQFDRGTVWQRILDVVPPPPLVPPPVRRR
jgi:hypothetical protein